MDYKTPAKRHFSVEEQSNRLPLYLQEFYKTRQLDRIKIDNNEIQGYFEYSANFEKTYVKSPVRASDGSIGNLDTYATFLTPRLVIKYKYMHIEDYRTLMKLLRSKNEFRVEFYDIVLDKRIAHNMYFAPDEMPQIHQRYLEVLGIKDYTVELIGTNTDFEKITVTYNLNAPSGITWGGETSASESIISNHTLNVGIALSNGEELQNVTKITFNNTYKFKYWCDTSDGTGFKYVDGNEYMFTDDTTLYAIWEAGAN